jgi:putative membrane protein
MLRATLVLTTLIAASFAGAAFADEGQQSGIPIPPVQAQPDDQIDGRDNAAGNTQSTSEAAQDRKSDRGAAAGHADHENMKLDKVAEKENFGPMTPENVLNKLHMTNQMEIKMGQLAVQKGNSEEVRQFGERLIQDHRKADEQVQQAAAQQNITLKDPMADDEKKQKHQKHMAKFENLSGEEFDKAFLKAMDKDHTKTLALLRKAQDKIDDEPVSQLISQLQPTIREHDRITDRLRGEMDVAEGYEFDPQTNELRMESDDSDARESAPSATL